MNSSIKMPRKVNLVCGIWYIEGHVFKFVLLLLPVKCFCFLLEDYALLRKASWWNGAIMLLKVFIFQMHWNILEIVNCDCKIHLLGFKWFSEHCVKSRTLIPLYQEGTRQGKIHQICQKTRIDSSKRNSDNFFEQSIMYLDYMLNISF